MNQILVLFFWALENWLFCKTWAVGRLVRFCKCANVGWANFFLNVRWKIFFKQSGRLVCRQSQFVSFCQEVKVRISEVYFWLHGRPKLTHNIQVFPSYCGYKCFTI